MNKEEKDLLLKDLCARLPYNVQIHGIFTDIDYSKEEDEDGFIFENEYDTYLDIETFDWFIHDAANIKPYLRTMSSMTEEELKEFYKIEDMEHPVIWNIPQPNWHFSVDGIDWLLSKQFDFRGLIEKGLAIEAPEEMYGKEAEK